MTKGDQNSDMISFERAQAITKVLFSLQEPWRERFLSVVARMAQGHNTVEAIPQREQVVQWLAQDSCLCQYVSCLVRSWLGCSDLYPN